MQILTEIRKTVPVSWFCLAALTGMAVLFLEACNKAPSAKDPAGRGISVLGEADQGTDSSFVYTYDLSSPDHRVLLPSILAEISGICIYDSVRLAGIQDEVGRIFVFRMEDGAIEKTINFAGEGDYEDITIVNDHFYVLKSNGNIYRVGKDQTIKTEISRYKTRLKSRNDCEGLTPAPQNDGLLIACKGSPSLDRQHPPENYRAIYRFSFQTADIDTIPYLVINTDEIGLAETKDWYQGISIKLANRLSQYENTAFQPSGIACHPVTLDFYILAHVGKMILVTNDSGEILRILPVDPAILAQPEGICFDDDGTLYLVSEGAGTDAVLAVFKAKNR